MRRLTFGLSVAAVVAAVVVAMVVLTRDRCVQLRVAWRRNGGLHAASDNAKAEEDGDLDFDNSDGNNSNNRHENDDADHDGDQRARVGGPARLVGHFGAIALLCRRFVTEAAAAARRHEARCRWCSCASRRPRCVARGADDDSRC